MKFTKYILRDIYNKRRTKKLAKSIAKTIIFGERKLMNLDWNIVTNIAHVSVKLKRKDIAEPLHFSENVSLLKEMLVDEFRKYFLKKKRQKAIHKN